MSRSCGLSACAYTSHFNWSGLPPRPGGEDFQAAGRLADYLPSEAWARYGWLSYDTQRTIISRWQESGRGRSATPRYRVHAVATSSKPCSLRTQGCESQMAAFASPPSLRRCLGKGLTTLLGVDPGVGTSVVQPCSGEVGENLLWISDVHSLFYI